MMMMVWAGAQAQSYNSLWKQVAEADRKDLPRKKAAVLQRIVTMADTERNYGQWLKASVEYAATINDVNPDSLEMVVDVIAKRQKTEKDAVAKAVLSAVLYKIYGEMGRRDKDSLKILTERYRQEAMAQPEKLAQVKADEYEPLVVKGYNAQVFGNDLLSVIGYETDNYKPLYDYYVKAGNRRAVCMTALELLKEYPDDLTKEKLRKSEKIHFIDSLINRYQDLDVAGEAAVYRYEKMREYADVTIEDKISYIHYALEKWGAWQGCNTLRNEEHSLTLPSFEVKVDNAMVRDDESAWLRLTDMRNVTSIDVNIYQTTLDGTTQLNPSDAKDFKKIKQKMKLMADRSVKKEYHGLPPYQLITDSVKIAPLPKGVYLIEVTSPNVTDNVRMLYHVSNLFVVCTMLPDKEKYYTVVDSKSGKPVKNAKIEKESKKWNNVYAYTDNDKAYKSSYISAYYYPGKTSTETNSQSPVLTDRAIYRPGQTIHASTVLYATDSCFDAKVRAGIEVRATLYDANRKAVETKTLKTDDYGKCDVDFVIPKGRLSGKWRVSMHNSSVMVSVEEYKRPTFRIEIPEVNEKYAEGDTVVVRATAASFAGVPVQSAKVSYTVSRQRALWWHPMLRGYWADDDFQQLLKTVEICSDSTITDGDGHFEVKVPIDMPQMKKSVALFYHFKARVKVTDMAGETHEAELSLPYGTKATVLSSDLPSKILADSLTAITFHYRNAAGIDISSPMKYRIDGGKWIEAHTITPCKLSKRLSSGKHTLEAVCEEDTIKAEVVTFNLDDKRPCVTTDDWFYVSDDHFADGKTPVTLQVGTSDKDAYVMYYLMAGDKIVEKGNTTISNQLINRKLTYKKEYGNGLTLCYSWVKNGKMHNHTASIKRPLPERNLDMTWTTFRDRLTPGQKETWTLNIKRPDGKPADASLFATMYDASLDMIAPHSLGFAYNPYVALPYMSVSGTRRMEESMMATAPTQWLKTITFQPSHFDTGLFGRFYTSSVYLKQVMFGSVANPPEMSAKRLNAAMNYSRVDMASAEVAIVADTRTPTDANGTKGKSDGQDDATADDALRDNLSESAFCYPSLHTDSTGAVSIAFTLPEALTTWRVMGVAHTKDVMTGYIEGKTIAQKELMVLPNMPRFVRVGDRVFITSRISNMTTEKTKANATITLRDAETGETVLKTKQAVDIDANATSVVTFEFKPKKEQLLVCVIKAENGKHADAEQHYLPVLSDRQMITTSRTITQIVPGTQTVNLTEMKAKGGEVKNIMVEHTANPAWMVVQALPSVAVPTSDNVVDQCAALYANMLGKHVARLYPSVKSAVEIWQQSDNAHDSRLQMNEGLKDIMLSETPWIADAESDNDRMMRLADFFDDNNINSRIESGMDKLGALQQGDGSFAWWKGMDGSLYLTVWVAEMLTRLSAMTGDNAADDMLNKACAYLDAQLVKEMKEIKKQPKNSRHYPTVNALRYMYVATLADRKLTGETKEAADYLLTLIKKDIKGQTIQEKAMTTVILAKRGDKSTAADYAKSLKEYLVKDDVMGMHYNTKRAVYSWRDYTIPTQTAAIEALQMVSPKDSMTISSMKRWLLGQKRTQVWDNVINTTDAVYAFLNGNAKALEHKNMAVVTVDGKKVDMEQGIKVLGYGKARISDNKAKSITIDKKEQGEAWTNVYVQSLTDVSTMDRTATGLSVKREIIGTGQQLKVGDKVKVRITITADRNYDYVQVADKRAACMEPVMQKSGYRQGCYAMVKDCATYYYINMMPKGTKVIETEYYIDRAGDYTMGACTVECAYAPEFRGADNGSKVSVK